MSVLKQPLESNSSSPSVAGPYVRLLLVELRVPKDELGKHCNTSLRNRNQRILEC